MQYSPVKSLLLLSSRQGGVMAEHGLWGLTVVHVILVLPLIKPCELGHATSLIIEHLLAVDRHHGPSPQEFSILGDNTFKYQKTIAALELLGEHYRSLKTMVQEKYIYRYMEKDKANVAKV